jgi:hypothetical protein
VPQQLGWADARAQARVRRPKLVYVGARRSLTGLNADQWIPAKPGSRDGDLPSALMGQRSAADAAQAADVEREHDRRDSSRR